MRIIPLWARALILLAIAAALSTGLYLLDQSRQQIGYDRATAEYNVEKLAQAKANQEAFAAMIKQRDEQAAALTASNDANMKKLQEAQHETARLRNLADSGNVGLRIRANCPAGAANQTQAPSNTGVDSGAGAELDAVARRAYFALRAGINAVEGKLAACQGELKLRQ